jgi:hypothetical protein
MKKLVVENDRLAVSHPVGDPRVARMGPAGHGGRTPLLRKRGRCASVTQDIRRGVAGGELELRCSLGPSGR